MNQPSWPFDDTQAEILRLVDVALDPNETPAAREEARKTLAAMPGGIDALDQQGRIDEALRRIFADKPAANEPATSDALRALTGRHRRLAIGGALAAAAAIVLLVAGVLLVPMLTKRSVESQYTQVVDAGYTPETTCESLDQFELWTRDRLGQTTTLNGWDDPEVEVLGWNVEELFSAYTAVLLTRVEGEEVVLLMDKASMDEPVRLGIGSDLHLHRKVVGALVVYEISLFEAPRVLPRLEKAKPRPF